MHACPHCQEKSISSFHKLISVSFAPAICNSCSKRSYLHVIHGLLALITWVIITWIFIGIALYQQMSIYLIGTIPALIFAIDRCMLNAPLRPCT